MPRDVTLSVELQPTAEGALPSEFRIFKAGINDTVKGKFTFDAKSAESVLAAAARRGVDPWIDYNHHTLNPPATGAKAAGWLKYEVRDGDLWATNVRWTPPAAEALRNKEFRYTSPAFTIDEENRVLEMRNIALENDPAMHNQAPLIAASARITDEANSKESPMRSVLVALGLKDGDDEGTALSAVQRLRDREREVVSLSGKATYAEALGELNAWKDAQSKVVALTAQVAADKAAAEEREFTATIEQATKDTKLPVASDDKRRLFALSLKGKPEGLITLRAYVDALPALTDLNSTVPPKLEVSKGVVMLSAEQKKAGRAMNVGDTSDYAAWLAKQQNARTQEEA